MEIDRFINVINKSLPRVANDIPEKNKLNSFFPMRTKGNEFEWDNVIGIILRTLLRKKIENYSYERFIKDCQLSFGNKLGEEEFWNTINEMYFENEDIFNISPEMLLFHSQKGEYAQSDDRFASLFINLMKGTKIQEFTRNVNFIEREIIKVFTKNTKNYEFDSLTEDAYLPYLSFVFIKDLNFLSSRPNYFLSEIKKFLSFYLFTYTAQISLALGDWKVAEEPQSKPLYFIMDHERASNERTHIRNHGYKLFQESCYKIFPILTMLELLQADNGKNSKKTPLWAILRKIKETEYNDVSEHLKDFAHAFRTQRELNIEFNQPINQATHWLEEIIKLAMAQFQVGHRLNINKRYVKDIEQIIAKGFFQSRGRSGRVLILNQDQIVLLTNLAVNNNERIRFQDLIISFQQRGVYFDKQSQQELIKFYDRIGNVERMSDSGDAIYVRKTI